MPVGDVSARSEIGARCLAFVTALVAVAGCAQRTEVVIGVATDLKAKGQLDLVSFTALRDGIPIIAHTWDLTDIPSGQYELPGSFGIYSPDGSEPRVDLQVQGFLDGQVVVSRESLLSLVSNETLFTRMALVSDCNSIDGPVCSSTQACIEGVCRDKAVDAHQFPPYQPPLVTHVACQSGSQFIVSSTLPARPCRFSPGVDRLPGPNQYCWRGHLRHNVLEGRTRRCGGRRWPVDQMSPLTDVLHAVWQTPDGQDVFAVGDAGTILHLHGGAVTTASSWVQEQAGSPATKATLTAVWGTSVDDVWAAGTLYGPPVSAVPPPPPASAVLLHRSMGSWTIVLPAIDASTVRGVSGTGPTDVWAVGLGVGTSGGPTPTPSPSGAAITNYDGNSWTVEHDADRGHRRRDRRAARRVRDQHRGDRHQPRRPGGRPAPRRTSSSFTGQVIARAGAAAGQASSAWPAPPLVTSPVIGWRQAG